MNISHTRRSGDRYGNRCSARRREQGGRRHVDPADPPRDRIPIREDPFEDHLGGEGGDREVDPLTRSDGTPITVPAAHATAPPSGIARKNQTLTRTGVTPPSRRAYEIYDLLVQRVNGVDTRPFAHPASPVSRASLGLSDEDVVLTYVGRVAPEKNSVRLAEAFALACESAPNLRLLVVGDGPSREIVEDVLTDAGVSQLTRFVGLQPYERIPDFEAAGDAFVTASVSEVHPLVVLEAMATGLPVIGVVSPGVADTVDDEVTGLLAPTDDAAEIAARMLRIAEDAGLRHRLGSQAQAESEHYDLPHTADLVLERYGRLIAARKRA